MKFDVPLDTGSNDHSHVEIFKSWRSFSDVFDGAKRMRVVTYCDSPEFILDLFEDLDDLDFLEVIVGDVSDYRERLIDKPDLADRLEQLRSEGKLVIYLCENKEVHSKLYLIEYNDSVLEEADEDGDEDQMTLGGEAPVETEPEDTDDGTPAKVIVGSPNLSRNAWSNQTNMGVVYDTKTDSELYGEFEELYRDHRDSYNSGGPFLEDLSEQLELSDDDREEVIKLYTEGHVGTQDELGEVHGRLADHIDAEVEAVDLALDGGTDTVAEQESEEPELDTEDESIENDPDLEDAPQDRITLSLRGYEESTVDTLSQMTDFDATVSNDTLTTTPDAFQRYAQQVFDVPTMHLNESKNELKFHYDGTVYRVTQPPTNPERIDEALAEIEDYFATVDNYGNSNNPTAVKAHMYEALLWFFWAPFANRQAQFYREHGINLDKGSRTSTSLASQTEEKGHSVDLPCH